MPTVTISQHTGLALVTIRGIGTNSGAVRADPSSTIHLDGVYLGRPAMVFADFLNVERVEVLRGPQGTLYGRNSVGGTINIVTRQPTNMLETSVRLTAGNYQKLRAEGAVSGPLIKNKVMGNFAVLRGTREGFVRDLNHPDHSLGAKTPGPDEGSCGSSWGRRASCCCRATTVDSMACPSPMPSRSRPSRTSPSTNRTSLWTVTHERPDLWEEHPAGCFGEAGRPIERHDDADQPDGVSKIQLSVLHRRRRHRTAGADVRRRPTSSVRSRRS